MNALTCMAGLDIANQDGARINLDVVWLNVAAARYVYTRDATVECRPLQFTTTRPAEVRN